MPMSCHAEVSSYQSWVIANRKTLLFRSGTYALSLAHMCEVLAALPILAFLLRSRRFCTRILFYSIVSTNFSWCNFIIATKNHLVNTPRTHENQRVRKFSSIVSIQYLLIFLVFFNVIYSTKNFFKKIFWDLQKRCFVATFCPVSLWKRKGECLLAWANTRLKSPWFSH